jgi:NAD+ synthase
VSAIPEVRADVPPDLRIDLATAEAVLVDFLRRETRKAGAGGAVVGLSGGVDSAVAATLAVRAFGPLKVLCALLPHRTSGARHLRDARDLARRLGARTVTLPITPMVEGYFRGRRANRIRRGNFMARQRMAVLYDLSAAHRAMVIGTSNKTELLLGYGTQFGDLASALNPLGDLYKTQVRALARHLGVPPAIADKVPTADLWTGQTDEAELGHPYDDLDRLLVLLVDRRVTPEEAVAAGFRRRMIADVRARMIRTQFKRRTPLIAKVAPRTVGIDFRYPRDWGR